MRPDRSGAEIVLTAAAERRLEVAGLAGLVLLAAFLVARTFMSWPQPTIDSGREWAIPLRVAHGERLYTEVVSFHGPVPVWLHAAAYRIAGQRVTTPLFLLVPLAILLLGSLHLLARRAAGPFASFAGTALALSIALVAPNGGALVFPYSFAALHALAWSAFGVAAATGRTQRDAPVILGWGIALACRPEIAAAAIGAALLARAREGDGWRWPSATVRQALLALAVAAVPWGVALRGVPLASLRREGPLVLLGPPEEWRAVYRVVSGLDDLRGSIVAVATAATLGFGLAGLALLVGRRSPGRTFRLAAGTALAVAGVALLVGTESGRVLDAALPPVLRAAPPALALLAFVLAVRKGPRSGAVLAVVALGALGASRVALGFSYGWTATPYAALAAPALCAALAGATALAGVRRAALAGALLLLAVLQVGRVVLISGATARVALDTGRGVVRLPPDMAPAFAGAISWLRANAKPGDAIAGFPEAGFLHLTTGLANPLRQDQVLPGHLGPEGEDEAVARLRERRPRFVVLLNQPSAAFGPVSFGKDYAVRLWSAVLEDWNLAASFGGTGAAEAVGPGPFFVRIYERRAGPVTPSDVTPPAPL